MEVSIACWAEVGSILSVFPMIFFEANFLFHKPREFASTTVSTSKNLLGFCQSRRACYLSYIYSFKEEVCIFSEGLIENVKKNPWCSGGIYDVT